MAYKPTIKANMNKHGWDKKQLTCSHALAEFTTDNNCGGWFETCIECHAILDAGMMGHN